MSNPHNVEKTMQSFNNYKRCSKQRRSSFSANYLQHADHYLRRLNELSERKENSVEKSKVSDKSSAGRELVEDEKNQSISEQLNYLNSDNSKSILILFNSNSSLSFPLKFFQMVTLV